MLGLRQQCEYFDVTVDSTRELGGSWQARCSCGYRTRGWASRRLALGALGRHLTKVGR